MIRIANWERNLVPGDWLVFEDSRGVPTTFPLSTQPDSMLPIFLISISSRGPTDLLIRFNISGVRSIDSIRYVSEHDTGDLPETDRLIVEESVGVSLLGGAASSLNSLSYGRGAWLPE